MSACEQCLGGAVGAAGLGPLAVQVVGVGLVWTTLHCSGMCGPLVASLRFGGGRGAGAATLDLFCYQSGRAVVYAAMGAAAGAAGLGMHAVLERWSPIIVLVFAGAFLLAAAHCLGWLGSRSSRGQGFAAGIARFAARAAAIAPGRPRLRAAALGAALAAMPCMLLFWVLSLAAASGNPLYGAMLMVLLVAMTTPVLLAAAVLPAVIGRLRRASSRWATPAALAFSAGWLAMVGLAGLGVVPHAHLGIGRYVVMFW